MFFRILKKDIRRKKTMNIILLLFVVLSAMFASSSVNNIITVVGGTDYYFEQAGMADYYFITNEGKTGDTLSEKLDKEPAVTGYRRENTLYINSDYITRDGKNAFKASTNSLCLMMSVDDAKINYFDKNNDVVRTVDEGTFYMSGSFAESSGIEVGDKLDLKLGDVTVTLEYAGRIKDALLGSDFMGNSRIMMNAKDYARFADDPSTSGYRGGLFYVDTDDAKAVEQAVADDLTITFDGAHSVIKMTYILEVITAGMLLVVSIALILISFVILRFTIGFTITEEFREIGVMKAIGIKNRHIRALYLVKYLGIAVIGAVIGYFVSIPFGELLLRSASKAMYLGNDSTVLIGALSCIAVVGIIMLFCWGCTRRIKKLSPIDAVRNGQTGERFRKHSFLKLSRSKLPATGFLAVNDVVSAPKQYSIMTLVFTLCLLLVMIFANIANTLASDKILFLLSVHNSDLYYSSKDEMDVWGGVKTVDELCESIEKDLSDLGMPANVHLEGQYKVPVEFGDVRQNITALWWGETKCSDYVYEQGTAPQNELEFAATSLICEKYGFDIGDKAKITVNGETKEYLLTGIFQSMNQLGQVIRLHEDAPLAEVVPGTTYPAQIDFDDDPDAKTIEDRKEILRKHWDSDKVQNVTEFVKDSTNSADAIAAVKNLVLIISVMIIVMIVVLMERSFIAKEKAEIALMKALGNKDKFIIRQHAFRFVIVAAVSGVLSAALCLPLTKLVADPIFAMMGASDGLGYELNIPEIFALYPVIILAAVIAGAFFTALYTRTVKASDAANIE